MRLISIVLCQIFLCLASVLIAQAQSPAETEFDKAARKNKEELELLLDSKKAPRSAYPIIVDDHRSVLEALRGFPPGSALLFYDVSDSADRQIQHLQLWLVSQKGVLEFSDRTLKPGELEEY